MISKIAKLANLIIDEKDLDKFEKDFSSILAYVNKLEELDVSGIEETANLSCVENVFRDDIEERKETKELLDLMPEKKDNYLQVNEVFEEND
ncbi:MAG: Asp-tRNA(Asn)/Glu-tRNA(Gln) amidotransferase subunit GatC [Candidatus Pacebacteria bacterium]|nr:Asp-tRNA(Asn)/Glu-tRNA(Gln) amidotransferase subunit GatC [Candidatus Paceibacterota bacterium]MDD5012985.1 Asp-tRNA(Asn)/Glu-tRNA(Gln) amidotransferase subunit GatC [Candidatus Paceibacterota bacterium]MDD5752613.1 Asp-tRNA(Asn)/Glu-tRNA(Gln) amidotransferase subunit GatC [Candidatus Paceibacterota bacterium]